MKKILKTVLSILILITMHGCAKETEIKKEKEIEIKEMRAIAELATVECYFHNVAKSDEPNNKAWYELWKKEKIRFWIEYEGIVSIGVKADELKMEVEGATVRITLPKAIVLNAKVNEATLSKDSFIYDINSQQPTAEQETRAFDLAQQNMINIAEGNTALLSNAEENAKELLENYIKSIGEAVGIQYSIEWIELEKDNLINKEADSN